LASLQTWSAGWQLYSRWLRSVSGLDLVTSNVFWTCQTQRLIINQFAVSNWLILKSMTNGVVFLSFRLFIPFDSANLQVEWFIRAMKRQSVLVIFRDGEEPRLFRINSLLLHSSFQLFCVFVFQSHLGGRLFERFGGLSRLGRS
jgi:hypothetical protein